MSFRFLFEILFYLPLYFYTLGQSPNFSESSILQSLILGSLLVVPLLGSVKTVAGADRNQWIKHPNLFVASALLILLFYFGQGEPGILLAVLVAIPIVFAGRSIHSIGGEFLMSAVLFVIFYVGINRFDPGRIFQWTLILPMVTGATYFLWYRTKKGGLWGFLIFVVLFAATCTLSGTLTYLWPLLIPVIVRVVLSLRIPGRLVVSDTITGILLGLYFIYYFLFANHVIQALTGGL